MFTTCRTVLLVSVCTLLFLAGCVPIQPETATTAAPPPTDTPTPEPTATPTPAPTVAAAVSDAWETFVDEARALSISYPPGWIFIDPSTQDLADLFAEAGERTGSEEIKELMTYVTNVMQQQGNMFVGMGYLVGANGLRESAFLNNFNVIAVPQEGLSLSLIVKLTAAQLDALEGVEVERAEVVAGLRPDGAEALSILSRMDGALYNRPDTEIVSWQVGLLSPEGETMLLISFSSNSEDFAELEPLLGEVVQRVEWQE